jgi:hypothetical protein
MVPANPGGVTQIIKYEYMNQVNPGGVTSINLIT